MGKIRTKDRQKTTAANGNGALMTPPAQRVQLEIALDRAREDLLGLATRSGLEILAAMLEQDREEVVGPNYRWSDAREAYRYGYDEGAVVMGGRKVRVPKPRVRSAVGGGEIVLPTWEWATRQDPLDQRTMQQMLVGVSTRSYAKSLEPAPPGIDHSVAVSRSSVSRRFVAQTKAKVEGFLGQSLADLDVRVVMIDGTWLGEHLMLVVLGIDAEGEKHVLGVREGTTENEGVCRSLLSELVERGLLVNQARLFVIDGGKGIRKAIRSVFGVWALIQRCQVHKLRNVLQHLPEQQHASVRSAMRGAWSSSSDAAAKRKLNTLARQLETRWPSAAASLREGLDETLTVLGLGITGALYRTLRSTNPIENLQSLFKRVTRRVTHWRNGTMARRWAVTGLMDAAARFRRIRGHADLRRLAAALDARCGAAASETDGRAQAAERAA
jgi:putative transposase